MKKEFKFPIVAFGSNTNQEDLNDYARSHGFPAGFMQFSRLVYAPDHKLAFTKYSKNRQGGVLDLIHSIGHLTEVALFYADETGVELLKEKEGVPRHYIEKEITVIDDVGNEIQALTFVVAPEKKENFVRPGKDYLRICKEGFEQLGINTYQLMAAAENEKAEPAIGLFCYGTLMRDEPRFPLVAKHGLRCALTAFCFGSLTTNKDFPSLNLDGDGFSRGDYFVSKDITSLLKATDQIEGFKGFGSKHNLFRRTCVDVDVGGGRPRPAWVYVRNTEFDTKVLDNDWRSFQGKREAFTEALVAAHEVDALNFYEELTWNYSRYSQIETLCREKVISLLKEEITLFERTLAQVSENWVALTNEKLGVTYA